MIAKMIVLNGEVPEGTFDVIDGRAVLQDGAAEWIGYAVQFPCGIGGVLAHPEGEGDLFLAGFAAQYANGRPTGVRLFNERGAELPASYAMTVLGMVAEAKQRSEK